LDQGNTPAREIGLPGAVLINLNAVVGAGMFALPALLYAGAGGFAPLVIIGFAFFVALDLLVWAKLSTQFDHSGGPQLYAEHAFGPFAGFQTGWFILAQNIAARAANFHVLVSYLAAIFPFFDHPAIRLATIFALIALFTGLAAVGTRRSIEALWIGTALKLGPILLICLVGLIANGLPSGFVMPEFTGGGSHRAVARLRLLGRRRVDHCRGRGEGGEADSLSLHLRQPVADCAALCLRAAGLCSD